MPQERELSFVYDVKRKEWLVRPKEGGRAVDHDVSLAELYKRNPTARYRGRNG